MLFRCGCSQIHKYSSISQVLAMLFVTIYDAGPTVKQHWVKVSCLHSDVNSRQNLAAMQQYITLVLLEPHIYGFNHVLDQ